MESTIEFHRAQPEVSLESHVRKRRIQLGVEVSRKYKIYLDLRFWILFRDIELNRNTDKNLAHLFSKVERLVNSGVAICPISESVFIELMKQNDPETRMATAALIDRLSLGVTLITHPLRVNQELCNAIYTRAGAKNLIPLDALVWTKLNSIFGETHPHKTPFEASEELVIQKAFLDHMWNISLTKIIKTIDFSSWHQPNWDETADRLNVGKAQHANEIKSYAHAYKIEFEGGLSLFKVEMLRLFKEVNEAGHKGLGENPQRLSEKMRFTRFAKSVCTLHISACCHAAVRWDQKRLLTGNDLLDFHHAEAAVGYCNLFLTEKPLRALLGQNHIGLTSQFPCRVESSVAGAQKLLNEISG